VDTGSRKRSCSINKLERDADSKRSHRALVALPGRTREHARQALGKQFWVRRPVAFEHARLIEQKMRRVFFQGSPVFAERGERRNQIVPRIDFQDRLGRGIEPPREQIKRPRTRNEEQRSVIVRPFGVEMNGQCSGGAA